MATVKKLEAGQSFAIFAVMVAVLVLFVLGTMDYMITNARMMEAVAVADLSAHAGVQEVTVLPNGVIQISPLGPAVAAQYFAMQAPPYIQLVGVYCGNINAKPGCEVTARVRSAGFLFPSEWITVRSIGYMVYGSTRPEQ